MRGVNGLHHVTAISGPAQENLDFYAGVLGMRLVKRSVNQDDPGTYHLFYADAEGHAGTDLTFFPWAHMAPSRRRPRARHRGVARGARGHPGLVGRASDRVRRDASAPSRRGSANACCRSSTRTACVSRSSRPRPAVGRGFTPWEASPVPVERQIRGLHGARARRARSAATAAMLTQVLGFVPHAAEGGWQRYVIPDPALGDRRSSRADSFRRLRTPPRRPRRDADARRGAWGTGSIHHLAWRVDDDAHELAMRDRVDRRRRAPDAGDRSLLVQVGLLQGARRRAVRAGDRRPRLRRRRSRRTRSARSLVLPPWLETQRGQIQAILPTLAYPPAPPKAKTEHA